MRRPLCWVVALCVSAANCEVGPQLEMWSQDEVTDWAASFLSGSSLEALDGLSGKELQAASYEDLHDLGIESIGHRKKILAAVAKLKADWMLHIQQYGTPLADQGEGGGGKEGDNPANDSHVWQHVRNIIYLWLSFGSMLALFYVGRLQLSQCICCICWPASINKVKLQLTGHVGKWLRGGGGGGPVDQGGSGADDATAVVSNSSSLAVGSGGGGGGGGGGGKGSQPKLRKGGGGKSSSSSSLQRDTVAPDDEPAPSQPSGSSSKALVKGKGSGGGGAKGGKSSGSVHEESSQIDCDQQPVLSLTSAVSDLQAQLGAMSQKIERMTNEHCGERASDLYLIEVLSQKVEHLAHQNQASQERQNHLVQQLGVFRASQDHLARALPQFVGAAPVYFQQQPPPRMNMPTQTSSGYPTSPPATSLPIDVFGIKGRSEQK